MVWVILSVSSSVLFCCNCSHLSSSWVEDSTRRNPIEMVWGVLYTLCISGSGILFSVHHCVCLHACSHWGLQGSVFWETSASLCSQNWIGKLIVWNSFAPCVLKENEDSMFFIFFLFLDFMCAFQCLQSKYVHEAPFGVTYHDPSRGGFIRFRAEAWGWEMLDRKTKDNEETQNRTGNSVSSERWTLTST